jgi:hypothetical protein
MKSKPFDPKQNPDDKKLNDKVKDALKQKRQ